jgi:hypothetical protein
MHSKPAEVLGFLLLIDLRHGTGGHTGYSLAVGVRSLRITRNNNKKATKRKKLYVFLGRRREVDEKIAD